MGIVFAIVAVIILMVVFGYYAHLQEKKRRELVEAYAAELGWSFDPAKDTSFPSRYSQFSRFGRGHSRFAHNTMRGSFDVTTEDGEVHTLHAQAGDYHYKVTSGSGKNRSTRTYRISYLLLSVPMAGGRDLLVRPENLGDKMKGAFGFDDIDFESAEFSDRFWVKSSDKRFAYDVIHPRMMEFLMTTPAPDIEISGGVMAIIGSGSRWIPEEFRRRLDWVWRFFALWPRHVQSN